MENKKIIRDGHIHSPYCPHGTADPFELYVERALELGLKEISFTEHMPLPEAFMDPEFLSKCSPDRETMGKYLEELSEVREKYRDIIKINMGAEVDYVEGLEEGTREILNTYGPSLQDSLLSVHFIKIQEEYFCVDMSPKEFEKLISKLGSIEKVYDKYYETLLKAVKADLGVFKPRRIGHPTLVRIFNQVYPLDYGNTELLEEIVKEIKFRSYQVDFNTAGIRKPYCKEIYPSGTFAELVKRYEVEVVYGSDAHQSSDLGRDFE